MTCDTKFVDVYNQRETSLEWLRQILLARNNDFVIGRHCDSAEAMVVLLEYLRDTSGDTVDYPVLHQEAVTCGSCNQGFIRRSANDLGDDFLQIALTEYPTADDVQGLLDEFISEVEKEVQCIHCHAVNLSRCQNEIIRTGNVLILTISRLDEQGNTIDIPLIPNTTIRFNGKNYSLKGFLHHSGNCKCCHSKNYLIKANFIQELGKKDTMKQIC